MSDELAQKFTIVVQSLFFRYVDDLLYILFN